MIPPVGLYSMVEQQKGARIIEGDKAYHLADLLHDAQKVDIAVRGRKRVIGVLCDRSYHELAAIYGIIRGGNAYLPISPDYPQERISVLLEQSGCDTVLVQEKYRSLIQGGLSIEKILAAPAPKDIPPVAAEPDDPLYVIFTSGSTGIPKGAMVSNRAALNRVLWMCRRYFSPDTVVMLKTPFTFDVSVWEIFGFALGGFTLYILPPEDHYRQDKVLEHIRKGQVTDVHFVPTVFRYFLEVFEKDGGELPALRNFFLSGEVLPANLVNAAPAPVHNLYGPTECAVDVTYYDCAAQETDPVPIGKPIDNCQIYVLDKYLQPLPVGATGQICIGGTPVGEGYVNDPVKTGAVFVPNPYAEGRLYLTGDLGYWREDGQLIFIGRNDQQVKINGQRIELGEIETVLNTVTSEAAVIAENNHLIAFYTGEERLDLREQLGRKLPRHMVPHHFIHVDTMPLTASGKIDRKVLASIHMANKLFAPPEGKLESSICALFSKTLGVDPVSRTDNFYDIGGTSLSMMELLCEAPLDSLSPSEFMQDPTPAGLAEILSKRTSNTPPVALYQPADAVLAYVLFPYGGGDAAAYTALVTEFRKRNAPVALYFVPWGCDYDAVAEKLRSFRLPLRFYSHCAGAAIAMKLLDRIDGVDRYIAGASIPPEDLRNIWPSMPDDVILSVLHKAGMPELPKSQEASLLRQFRENTAEYFEYFQSIGKKKTIRAALVLGEDDIFTGSYPRAAELWEKYIDGVESIRFIKCSTHYFQSSHAAELADILLD